jgi:hypothetical protein
MNDTVGWPVPVTLPAVINHLGMGSVKPTFASRRRVKKEKSTVGAGIRQLRILF